MLDLRSHDWYTITGRGKVASVTIPTEGEQVKVGSLVRIDGAVYKVSAIERYTSRRDFGLVVRELRTSEYITCPVCAMTSYNLQDIREGYCGNCHGWTTPLDRLPG